MYYLGDFVSGSTVPIPLTTNRADGAAVAPSSSFESADIRVYKNASDTQRSSDSGITMTSPFDSVTGLHWLTIDLSDDTDTGFWAAGNDYTVVLVPDETVDSQSVVAVLAMFSIENRVARSNVIQLGGDAQSATDLKDFADDGYDPSTNKVAGVVQVDTLSGHTPQTGDTYARLGAPAGASVSADVAAVKSQTAAIEADTQDLQTQVGTAGAGLTNVPWNASWDAQVESEVTDALNAYDPPTTAEMEARTLTAASYGTAANQTTILARLGAWTGTGLNTILGAMRALMGKTAALTPSDITAAATSYDNTTDSLEAIRDRGDSTWATAGLTITPVQSTVSAGQVVSDDITIYQGETKVFLFVLTDDTDTAINESGDTLTLVVQTLDGTHLFEESGSVGGADNNQITVTVSDDNTDTAGTFRYSLWNETEDVVRARGACEIVATVEPEA